ncbi:MAG: radical SAM protein [Anaerolineaceae bacterium]|nr:MAG: radical SAM protein [Anaerolineaceae bacterium]
MEIETYTRCIVCDQAHPLMAEVLGLCPDCARCEVGIPQARIVHSRSRQLFGLPEMPPRAEEGVQCVLCGCECVIGDGEYGFCGLRTVQDSKLRHIAGIPQRGVLHWYRDPVPTNCVAAPVCAASKDASRGLPHCRHNLSVFYYSCTIDCLFCQNWHFRTVDAGTSDGMSAQELAAYANTHTFCACYFGGDPASQMPHALASAKLLAEKGVVICWETAATANPRLMDRAVQLSLQSGGCVKFDLKAYSEPLHIALTGWSNRQTLANFTRAVRHFHERPTLPLVVASTLLVPGYVDAQEVGCIAAFIAEHDPDIPYVLLGFAPHYLMPDLPRTSVKHAEAAYQAALNAGLRHVRIGNRHLLGHGY